MSSAFSLLLILLCGYLSGCVSTEKVMRSWQGKPVEELITTWGAPSSQSRLKDGRSVYSWISNWGSAYLMNTCRQSFTVNDQGFIELWRFSGCPHWQADPGSLNREKPELAQE